MVKILLVEDNPLNQDMLSRRLARQGFDVTVAIDGAAGLSLAKTEKPDLILMDMNIPIIDGWEATRRLKADGQTRAIPVVAITAHAMVGDREKAINAGCDDYATKPVEFKQLLKTIRTFTTGATSSQQSVQKESASVANPAQTVATNSPPISLAPQQTKSAPDRPKRTKSSVTSSQTAASTDSETPFTLLVVNDNLTNRKILSAHLQRKGYTVVTAEDPAEALNILQEFSIDLVLLDLMTPEDSNLRTLQEIRKTHPKALLAVIMITVHDSDDSIVEAFELGVSDYVSKPINLAIVMARIKSQLETLKLTRQQVSDSALQDSTAPSETTAKTQLKENTTQAETDQSVQESLPTETAAPLASTSVETLSSVNISQTPSSSQQKQVGRNNTSAVLLHTKLYPPGYVFSENSLGQVKLVSSPNTSGDSSGNPSGKLWALQETFTKTLLDADLVTKVRHFIQTERPELETISKHERVAELISFSEQDDAFGWLQTYTEGHLFAEEIRSTARISIQSVLCSIQDILEALLPFHESNIVHCSIQPHHLWRARASGQLILINPGLSQRLCGYLSQQTFKYRNAFTIEHEYMPIEQRIGQPVLSSDIYAVGLIALQLLTGKTTTELTNLLLSGERPFEKIPMVSARIAQVLAKMLPQEAGERYHSAAEALQDVCELVRIQSGHPNVTVRP